jgi:hypothetical protein
MAPRSKVATLPPALKEWLDAEMMRRGFADYVQLAADLKARGADVSKSSLHRYGTQFERRMAQLKMASEQARALVDAAPDDEDKLGSAVVRMTQEKIFGLLMEIDVDAEDVDINKLFKNAAEIGKASVALKRYSMEARAAIKEEARRELVEQQRAQLEAMPNKGGVTAETKAAIREALGIV